MKALLLKCVLALLGTVGLLASASLKASPLGLPDNQENAAAAASRVWLAQIDANKFEESYNAGCREFHDKVSEDQWINVLQTLRSPFGPVTNRKELQREYKPNGVNGLDGECMMFTYATSFKNLPDAFEITVLKRDGDHWLGAGYVVTPKPNQQADAAPPSDTQVDSRTIKNGPMPDSLPKPTPAPSQGQ